MSRLEANSGAENKEEVHGNVLVRVGKFIGHNALKGLFWGMGFTVIAAPLGYIGLERFEESTSELKTSVDRFNETVGNGSQVIGTKLGELDSTARGFVPATTTTVGENPDNPESNPTNTTQLLVPGEEQAEGPPVTEPVDTTTTTVAGQK